MTRIVLGAVLALLAGGVAAQPAPGLPEPMQGVWYQGGPCSRPEALLFVTPRTVARVPALVAPGTADVTSRLWRFTAVRPVPDWTLGTAGGSEAPRLLLRLEGADGTLLGTAEPDAKVRDDRLPGVPADLERTRWVRCAGALPQVLALHAEGLAVLAALEHVEAACAPGAPANGCGAAIVAAGDVSGDGVLSRAEVARLARGAAWVIAVDEGMTGERLAAAVGIGALVGLAARSVMDSLDYDGDGRLSAAELGQDRQAFGTARGTAAGAPLRDDTLGPGIEALRGLLNSLGLGN